MKSDMDYKTNFELIVTQAGLLSLLPLQQMLDTVNLADSFGGMLDPTAYRAGMKNLPPQRDVLEAAIKFVNTVKKATGAQ